MFGILLKCFHSLFLCLRSGNREISRKLEINCEEHCGVALMYVYFDKV